MKKNLLSLLLMHSFFFLHAQQNLGISNSNYAGIQGATLNPSFIADSKLKWDVNILSGDVVFDNTFVYMPKDSLKFLGFKNIIHSAWYQEKFSTHYDPQNPNELFDFTFSNEAMGP